MKAQVFLIGLFATILILYGPTAIAMEKSDLQEPEANEEAVKVAQLAASAEGQEPVAEVSEDAADEKEEAGKWWSLAFSYSLAHNLAYERPEITNSFSIDPGFMAPYDIAIGLHLGFYVSTQYPSSDSAGRDVTVNTVDMDPISANISRGFVIDEEYSGFRITPSLGLTLPYSSKYTGQATKWYFAIKPGVAFAVSKWGLSLSNSNSFQKNFHGDSYVWRSSTVSGTMEPSPLNEWVYNNSTSLRYSVWKVSMGVGVSWSHSWRYDPDVTEQASNSLSYSADVGIEAYDGLNFTLGISTAGPERRNGGFKSDYTLPLDPQFTVAFLSIAYSL